MPSGQVQRENKEEQLREMYNTLMASIVIAETPFS